MKQLTVTFEGKEYTLEYTRSAVRQMERRGFVADDIASKPMTIIPDLFAGAFLSKYPQLKREKIDQIFDSIVGKQKLLRALTLMYNDTIESLLDDGDAESGEENWTPNFEILD